MTRFIENFIVARAVVKQLRNNEWEFKWNSLTGSYLTAERNGKSLWVGNIYAGGWFCDAEDGCNLFGYFWRHYVAYFGVVPAKRKAIKSKKTELLQARKK